MEDGVSDYSKYEPGVAPISYFPFFGNLVLGSLNTLA